MNRLVVTDCLCLLALLVLDLGYFSSNVHGSTLVNFSDLTLPNAASQTQYAPDGTTVTGYYWNGPDPNGTTQPDGYGYTETVGQFSSAGVVFSNIYDNKFGSWSGWSYSNVDDATDPGYTNQYAAYAGTAVGGSGIYAVAYGYSMPLTCGSPLPTITIPAGMQVQSAMFTNTTYAALSMLDGDGFAKQFGPSDWFLLTITGEGASNNVLGSVGFYLKAINGPIVSTWQSVNLSPCPWQRRSSSI